MEGLPCHLHFDLEYSLEYNEDVDGNALVTTLLHMVHDALLYVQLCVYGVCISGVCVCFHMCVPHDVYLPVGMLFL